MTRAETGREMFRKTRRSLVVGGLASIAGAATWEWLRSREPDGELAWPLRTALKANGRVSRDYFNDTRLARTFPAGAVEKGRVNGDIGLDDEIDPNWKLSVEGAHSKLALSLNEIKALPKMQMITELKCIEGWSRVLHWGGARFRDFVKQHAPEQNDPNGYVSFSTPDREYYAGVDMASALHPQTLLCYEMNGEPLSPDHGAPVRLVVPVKYGIKNVKRLGTIAFSATQPPDYWAERGYDWYAGF